LRQWLARLNGLDVVQIAAETQQVRGELAEVRRQAAEARQQVTAAHTELAQARSQIVLTEETALLQEVGVYDYHHPLADAVTYKSRLADLKDQLKTMTRGGRAVLATTNWQINGSARAGAKMVADFSKLMLRAYNAEADNCVRTVRPHTVRSAIDRLSKARETIARLGKTMDIRISNDYHRIRVLEIEMTADYLVKVEEEKERVRAERERQREEEAARREFERERARLAKEQSHYRSALAKLQAKGDEAGATELQAKLTEIAEAIAGVEAREANVRAGYVYVISNLGAFGERMVKIGMTRRLEPMDRIRELGDASVPFRFDTHALIFSEDAVGLEGRLHAELADRRVNRVNVQREFFYATPAEVRDLLERIAGQHVLEYHETPEALEWRASGQHHQPSDSPTDMLQRNPPQPSA
jgi:hypothetical protein